MQHSTFIQVPNRTQWCMTPEDYVSNEVTFGQQDTGFVWPFAIDDLVSCHVQRLH